MSVMFMEVNDRATGTSSITVILRNGSLVNYDQSYPRYDALRSYLDSPDPTEEGLQDLLQVSYQEMSDALQELDPDYAVDNEGLYYRNVLLPSVLSQAFFKLHDKHGANAYEPFLKFHQLLRDRFDYVAQEKLLEWIESNKSLIIDRHGYVCSSFSDNFISEPVLFNNSGFRINGEPLADEELVHKVGNLYKLFPMNTTDTFEVVPYVYNEDNADMNSRFLCSFNPSEVRVLAEADSGEFLVTRLVLLADNESRGVALDKYDIFMGENYAFEGDMPIDRHPQYYDIVDEPLSYWDDLLGLTL